MRVCGKDGIQYFIGMFNQKKKDRKKITSNLHSRKLLSRYEYIFIYLMLKGFIDLLVSID